MFDQSNEQVQIDVDAADRRDPARSGERESASLRFRQHNSNRSIKPALTRSAVDQKRVQAAAEAERKRLAIQVELLQRRLTVLRVRTWVHRIFFGNFAMLALVFGFGGGWQIASAGDVLTTAARFGALLGTYLLLVQLVLVGRVPWLDQLYGHDKLIRWHRKNGRISFTLLTMHVFGVVVGRALNNHVSIFAMTATVMRLPYMPQAVVAFALMIAAIVTSVRGARGKIKFEHWHLVHLWTYVGVAISFGHELNGPDFDGQWLSQSYIWTMYVLTFATVGYFRIVYPIRLNLRHQLRVRRVVEEAPGVTSIYMTGISLSELDAKAGQFCYWRFVTKKDVLQAHPYSISAAPNGKYLRITVKSLGDASSRIGTIPVGTRVLFEGPYGRFTGGARRTHRTVLIAGGVGVTPIRSLMETIDAAPGDLTVLYRVDMMHDAVLADEMQRIADQRGATLHLITGKREDYPTDQQPLSPDHLEGLIDNIHDCDIYVCAAPGMTKAVVTNLKALHVPRSHVHFELFG